MEQIKLLNIFGENVPVDLVVDEEYGAYFSSPVEVCSLMALHFGEVILVPYDALLEIFTNFKMMFFTYDMPSKATVAQVEKGLSQRLYNDVVISAVMKSTFSEQHLETVRSNTSPFLMRLRIAGVAVPRTLQDCWASWPTLCCVDLPWTHLDDDQLTSLVTTCGPTLQHVHVAYN
eukprot:PhF_6_TR36061/c0_g1_i6/m.52344